MSKAMRAAAPYLETGGNSTHHNAVTRESRVVDLRQGAKERHQAVGLEGSSILPTDKRPDDWVGDDEAEVGNPEVGRHGRGNIYGMEPERHVEERKVLHRVAKRAVAPFLLAGAHLLAAHAEAIRSGPCVCSG